MTLDSRELERACVRAVLAGEPGATTWLFELVGVVVHARVARVLLRAPRGANRRQDILDYQQEAFETLITERGRALRGWDPDGRMSLKNYVGQRVEWFMFSRLRAMVPTELWPSVDADAVATERSVLEERDQLQRLLGAIEARWSSFGVTLFLQLFVLQASSKQVAAETGLGCDAVDQWRFRMREFSRGFLHEE